METSQRYTLTLDGCYVMDSWDCYREVVRPRRWMTHTGTLIVLPGQRRRAARICERLNREHDEWIALGRVA